MSRRRCLLGHKSIPRNWRDALDDLEGAYAPNTLRSYRSDFEIFEAWCATSGACALPASPETVAAFFQSQQESVSPTTLSRRQCAIRKIHRLLRLPNPTDDEAVSIALRRARRLKGTRARQALGLTRDLREQLVAAAPDHLKGTRDAALLCVGYDTLCRRSELAALQIEDLKPNRDGTMTILIRRAKDDQFGAGRLGLLSKRTVGRLREWLRQAGLKTGALFRAIDRHGHVRTEPLDGSSINRIIKAMARDARLPKATAEGLSGHSMRVGRAQDLMLDGFDLLPIMKAGGWKSYKIVGRYVENVELAKLLKTRGAWE